MKRGIEKRYNRIRNAYSTSNIAQRLANGAFWSLTGTAVSKLIVLISGIICAHILGKAEYGELGMVRSTINLFIAIGGAGLGATATKYISEFRFSDRFRITSIYLITNCFAVLFGALVCLLFFVSSDYLSANYLHAQNLSLSIKVGSLLLFVSILDSAQNGTLMGFEDFKSIALNTFMGSIFESLFMILGAYYCGVMGAILGFGVGYVVIFIANFYSIKKNFNILNLSVSLTSINYNDLRLLYKYSLPAALAGILVGPVFWVVRSMLVRHDGFEELAVYEVADQWKIMLLFIPGTLSQIVLPILSSLSSTESKTFWNVLKINMFLNGGIATLMAIIICLISPFILYLYGYSDDSLMPLIFLSLSTIFTALASVVGASISSKGQMWIGFGFNFVWAIMVVFFSYIFVNQGMKATGIALAILVAYFFHTLFQAIYVKSLIS